MGVTWPVPAHYFGVRSDLSRNVVGLRDSGYEFESIGIERASQHNNCRLIKVLETGGADARGLPFQPNAGYLFVFAGSP